jgi:hypothetical protein
VEFRLKLGEGWWRQIGGGGGIIINWPSFPFPIVAKSPITVSDMFTRLKPEDMVCFALWFSLS